MIKLPQRNNMKYHVLLKAIDRSHMQQENIVLEKESSTRCKLNLNVAYL